MEAPELPEGYFFRVTEGRDSDIFISNDLVQLRRKFIIGSILVDEVELDRTECRIPTPDEIEFAMHALILRKEEKEERAKRVSHYGDYPPKKLSDLK